MTCGAAILHWIEPADATGAVQLARAASLQDLRDAIETSSPLLADHWQAILVEPRQLSRGTQGRMLAARSERRDYHFVIDPAGRVEPTTPWQHQQSVQGSPHVIRICLGGPNVEALPSREQWQSLLGLLDALRRECRIAPDQVHLSSEEPDDPTLESVRARLRRKLLAAGVLG